MHFFDKFEHFSQNKYCYKTFVFDFNEVKEVSSMFFFGLLVKVSIKINFQKAILASFELTSMSPTAT